MKQHQRSILPYVVIILVFIFAVLQDVITPDQPPTPPPPARSHRVVECYSPVANTIIPRMEMDEMPFEEVLEFIRNKQIQYSPQGDPGISYEYRYSPSKSSAPVTISLTNVRVRVALERVIALQNVTMEFGEDRIIFKDKEKDEKTDDVKPSAAGANKTNAPQPQQK